VRVSDPQDIRRFSPTIRYAAVRPPVRHHREMPEAEDFEVLHGDSTRNLVLVPLGQG
jgi:hypothetical protein